jgi:hypothetical protein
MLDVFLPLNGVMNGGVDLKIDERVNLVALDEPIDHVVFVLENTSNEVIGDPDIERTAGTTG